jgi:hypothetical protein
MTPPCLAPIRVFSRIAGALALLLVLGSLVLAWLTLRFDRRGRLRERMLAELPPLARDPRTVDTFVLDATPTRDGGLGVVIHHATGGVSSPQYRIRLVPAGAPVRSTRAASRAHTVG